jgi:hypothetical protein
MTELLNNHLKNKHTQVTTAFMPVIYGPDESIFGT